MGSESQARRVRRIARIVKALNLEPSFENFVWAKKIEKWERRAAGRMTAPELNEKAGVFQIWRN